MSKAIATYKLKINECAQLIATAGDTISIIIEGEPGTGKTSIQKLLKEKLGPEYDYIYVDCPLKGPEEVGMSIPRHDERTLAYYVSELFQMGSMRPKVVMLDEIWKSDKMMKKVWTRLVQERYVGDRPLPVGSIVWGTSNNITDEVGDSLEGHVGNRVTRIEMKKPDHNEWVKWATDHGISALTRAWVCVNTSCMNSYRDLTDTERVQNPFIFNPRNGKATYFSPRSAEKNDVYVKNRDMLGMEVTMAAMAGTVGQAAAESMQAFFLIEKDLMSVAEIIADPEHAPLSQTNHGATLMTYFNAVDEIKVQDDLSQFMKYVQRHRSREMQSLFYSMVCGSKKTVLLARNNKVLSDWLKDNFVLFT